MKIRCLYVITLLLVAPITVLAGDGVIDFVEVHRTDATDGNNVEISYLSERLPSNAYLASGFIANHENVFPIAKFGGEVKKGGRCGYFPEIKTMGKVEGKNVLGARWMFHVAVDQKTDFSVPVKISTGQLPFIPADLDIDAIERDFRLFLFASYNKKSSREENIINVSDGINFGIADLQGTDMNIAEYAIREATVDLERYKFDQEEFLLFKLYFKDEQRDQSIQIASFLYQKKALGMSLVSKSTNFLNWFWVRTKNSEPGKYDADPWFQGVMKYHGVFYVLTQGHGYESISVSLQKLEDQRLVDVRVYADGC